MAKQKARGQWECGSYEVVESESWEHTVATARCSCCKKWCEQIRDWTARVDYEFCPHCGTKMDGGEENAN